MIVICHNLRHCQLTPSAPFTTRNVVERHWILHGAGFWTSIYYHNFWSPSKQLTAQTAPMFTLAFYRRLGLFAEFRRPSTRPIWKRFTPSPRLRRSGQCTTIFLPLQRFRWGTATIWWGKKDARCGKNLTTVMGALGRSNASNLIL